MNELIHYTKIDGQFGQRITEDVDITLSVMSQEVAKGYSAGYNNVDGRHGVIHEGTFYPTVPLNSSRTRALEEWLLAVKRFRKPGVMASLFVNGCAQVPLEVMKDLPAFDSKNLAFLDSFTGPTVLIHIVSHEPGYGFHALLTDFDFEL